MNKTSIVRTILICFTLISTQVLSATYYFSEKGNNSNSGTSKIKPWKTFDPLTKPFPTLQPGDSILLERGSTFRDIFKIFQSGTKENLIYIGAYGVGQNPIVKGSLVLSQWKTYKKNIWVADCPTCETRGKLFINDLAQPLGRFPDRGYLSIYLATESTMSFTDSSLSHTDDYWQNAEAVVKSSRWTIDRLPISDFRKRVLTYSVAPSYPLEPGFGYFIQNHINTLNKNGEWYFDESSKKIYVFLDSSFPIQTQKIEVSVHPTGLALNKVSFITIENLQFNHFTETGILMKDCESISIGGITIKDSAKNGLVLSECKNPIVKDSRIENSSNNGVEWINNTNGEFIHNEIVKTGLIAGQGSSGNGTYIGLSITGEESSVLNSFRYNRIDSTGYIGIDFRTGGNTIKNNLIQNFCLTKDDGAGIYTWGNSRGNNTIEGNIVLHGKGNSDGTIHSSFRYASGIYIDDNSSKINIKDNTVGYCAQSGIFIHNSGNLIISNNTLVGNGNHFSNKEKGQLYVRQDELVKIKIPLALDVSQNKFIAIDESSNCIAWRGEKQEISQSGTFVDNYYFAPKPDQVAAFFASERALCNGPENYTISEWRNTFSLDANSDFEIIPSGYRSSEILSVQKTDDWIIWPDGSKSIPCEGSAINCVTVNPPTSESEALLYHTGFALEKNRIYRISFTARSDIKTKVEFVPLMANSPWAALSDYSCFALGNVFKKYSIIFTAGNDCAAARLNFKNNRSWQLKDVLLEEITSISTPVRLTFNASGNSIKVAIDSGFCVLRDNQCLKHKELGAYQAIITVMRPSGTSSKRNN